MTISTALAECTSGLPASPVPDSAGFTFDDLRIFTSVPAGHDVTPLAGMVAVYDTDALYRAEIVEGALYVVERQYPVSGMNFGLWLRRELEDNSPRSQPVSPLRTSREVVQMVRGPKDTSHWYRRLPSGFHDGPFPEWSAGQGMVGKVVGLFQPSHGSKTTAEEGTAG